MKREYGRALASFRTHFLSSTVHFQQRNRFCTNTIKVGDEWVRASERKKQKEKQRQSPHFKHPVLFFVFVVFFYFSSWWLSSFLMKFCFHLSLYELTRFVFRLVHWAFTLMWLKSQPFHLYIVYAVFGTTSILLKIARFRVCALQYNVHICGTAIEFNRCSLLRQSTCIQMYVYSSEPQRHNWSHSIGIDPIRVAFVMLMHVCLVRFTGQHSRMAHSAHSQKKENIYAQFQEERKNHRFDARMWVCIWGTEHSAHNSFDSLWKQMESKTIDRSIGTQWQKKIIIEKNEKKKNECASSTRSSGKNSNRG